MDSLVDDLRAALAAASATGPRYQRLAAALGAFSDEGVGGNVAKSHEGNTIVWLEEVLAVAHARLDESISLQDMAFVAGMSRFQFCRAFKTATGISPHQYLLELRINVATEMLTSTRTSLAEIAYECGFSSQAHMTDVFRKRKGVTPGSVRKSAGQASSGEKGPL